MSGVGQVTKRLLVGRPYASDRAMEQLHLPTAGAFAYARETRPETLTALPVETGNADTRTLQEEWERRGVPARRRRPGPPFRLRASSR